MKTGGGVIALSLTENPDMELVMQQVDNEFRFAIDSNTVVIQKRINKDKSTLPKSNPESSDSQINSDMEASSVNNAVLETDGTCIEVVGVSELTTTPMANVTSLSEEEEEEAIMFGNVSY